MLFSHVTVSPASLSNLKISLTHVASSVVVMRFPVAGMFSRQGYKPLSDAPDVEGGEGLPTKGRIRRDSFLKVIGVLAIMLALFSGIKGRMWTFCRGMGGQRHLSGLPSHFELPSGDKIPSVALGTGISAPYVRAVLTKIRL